MLRTSAVILLALCVLAMPSYAAIACGSSFANASDPHDCCPETPSAIKPANSDVDGSRNTSHSSENGRNQCAAPCCGFVAHVPVVVVSHAIERSPVERLLSESSLHGSVDHDAIFHPPRI